MIGNAFIALGWMFLKVLGVFVIPVAVVAVIAAVASRVRGVR